MPYITSKPDPSEFQENFRHNMGRYPDSFEHAWGMIEHEMHYQKYESWCALIDIIVPDAWYCQWVQDWLMGIVKGVYDRTKWGAYDRGTEKARKVEDGINQTIDWAKNQITNAVSDMRNRIDTEIVSPIRNKVNNEIMPKLSDAESRLATLKSDVDKALSDVNTMKSNIASFDSQIKSFSTKLSSFDSKLSTLNSMADSLNTRLKDAENRLTSYKALIDDLDRRVKSLEEKKTEVFPLLKW